MKSRKEELLKQRITELEQRLKSLTTDNELLRQEIKNAKRAISFKDRDIAELQKHIAIIEKARADDLNKIKELHAKLTKDIAHAKELRNSLKQKINLLFSNLYHD